MDHKKKTAASENRPVRTDRIADLITVIGMAVTLLLFSVLTVVLPDSTFSAQENRVLQQKPALSSSVEGSLAERIRNGRFLDRLFSGAFTEEVGAYYKDQFPLRSQYIAFRSAADVCMGKRQVNDVMIGADGVLITRKDYPAEAPLEQNLKSYAAFAEEMARQGIPCTFAAAGRSMDVLTSYYPAVYDEAYSERIWSRFDSRMQELGQEYVNLMTPLKSAADAGRYVYYRTDHHWTTEGAYEAYRLILESMGMEPQERKAFTAETVSVSFFGTTWSKVLLSRVEPDRIEYYRYEGDEAFTTEIVDSGRTFAGFYDRAKLEEKDQYSSFIGGNNARVRITANDASDREKLLIVKDSYAHSAAPFLAYHFDLEIVDLRYYRSPLVNLIREEGIDRVLVLYNMENLTDQPVLGAMAAGIGK